MYVVGEHKVNLVLSKLLESFLVEYLEAASGMLSTSTHAYGVNL